MKVLWTKGKILFGIFTDISLEYDVTTSNQIEVRDLTPEEIMCVVGNQNRSIDKLDLEC